MELFVIGIVVALNIVFIIFKYQKQRYLDATLDSTLLTLVTIVFMGSYAGLVVATIASMIVSIYLYFNPPKFSIKSQKPLFTSQNVESFVDTLKRKLAPRYK